MLLYVGHIISLILYFVVIVSATCTAVRLQRLTLPMHYAWTFKLFVGAIIAQASMFLWIQTNSDTTTYEYIRLAYDIFNGFILMTFATVVDIYIRWNQKKIGRCQYKRRADDYPSITKD